jgi:hypothetical protein
MSQEPSEAALESLWMLMEPIEEPEHLITSAEVNRAGAAKANELWGGKQ